MKKLLVKNSQGDIYELEMVSHPEQYMVTLFLISTDVDLPDEMTTVDLLNESIIELLESEGYKKIS